MLPDLESLRCFVAAARHMSFRKAAREVALSPAAFSDRIRKLEHDVGDVLFLRTTRSVALSIAGERILPHAKETLAAAARCRDAFSTSPQPFDLVIGTRFELGLSWLLPQFEALAKERPERRLHLFFGDSEALFAGLDRGAADAVITSARFSKPNVAFTVLHEEDYALVASPELLKKSPLRSHRDAAASTLLDLHPDRPLFRYFLDGRPPGEVWNFAHVQHLGTIAAVLHQATAGRGVAVLPRYFAKPNLDKKKLVEPFPKLKMGVDYFRLVYRAGHPREQALAELGEALRGAPLR